MYSRRRNTVCRVGEFAKTISDKKSTVFASLERTGIYYSSQAGVIAFNPEYKDVIKPIIRQCGQNMDAIIHFFVKNHINLVKQTEGIRTARHTVDIKKAFTLYFDENFKITNKENAEFESLNAVKEGSNKNSTANLASMKNMLFEFDKLSIAKQQNLAEQNQNIVSRATYSGNKFIHTIVTLDKEPVSVAEYKYMWYQINQLYFAGKADTACATPAHNTRIPGGVNHKTGKVQKLLFENAKNVLHTAELHKQYMGIAANLGLTAHNDLYGTRTTGLRQTAVMQDLRENGKNKGMRNKVINAAIWFLTKCSQKFRRGKIKSMVIPYTDLSEREINGIINSCTAA